MKRRDFLVGTGAVMLSAASYGRILGANDRLGIALVGSGRRGRWVLHKMLATDRINAVTMCDVWGEQMQRTKDQLGITKIKKSYDLDEVLEDKNIDAVVLATPDHLHQSYAARILAANKHLYLEKPVTLHYEEGAPLKKAVNDSKVVCQTGTQQRSGELYQRVKEEFFGSSKRLGDVIFVRAVWSDFGWQRRAITPRSKPKNFEWDTFLGPSEKIPYDWARYDAWRNYKEYGTGILSDLLTHWGDVAQWMMDDANPLDAVTTGGIYHLKDGRSNPDTVNSIIRYKGGWNFTFECSVMPVKNTHDSVLFHGTEGKLELFRAGYIYTPHNGEPETVTTTESLDTAHVNNFFDAITRGKPTTAPIEIGLEAIRPSHLAASAYWTGKRVKFNEDHSKIIPM
ncbi:Gfo/Idh/MocA family protein [Spongiimicrobium sp. 3-5]|uniref:Gfo/Idh/MocA family protein n=1 Tax=Spongiimicrobium sp. 3-5 TaxID=3332596 RepID=UPI00398143D6